jgi:hypothetical protein
MEILVTLVIVCLFTVVVTQFIGVSFKDMFFKSSQMDAVASAQNLMEKITAVVETQTTEAALTNALNNMGEYVIEDNLLVYDAAHPVQFNYEIVESYPYTVGDTTEYLNGVLVSVVVFYNDGKYYINQKDNFIYCMYI